MKHRVFYKITGSAFADIEAETLEEAMNIAQGMPGEDFEEADDREWELDFEFTRANQNNNG